MKEFTAAQDYRGRQDKRIEYKEPLEIQDSPFGVSIRDVYLGSAPVRLYMSGDAIFSGMYLDRSRRDELVFDYTEAYDRMFLRAGIRNVLMLGGAAYTYPRHCLIGRSDITFTVVDADPCAEEIARSYFFLNEFLEDMGLEGSERFRLVTADGRAYLDQCGEKFDAILNDAFVGASPVGSLATREAARRIRRSLTPGGVYMTNILASITGRTGRFLRAEVKTLREVFAHVLVFPVTAGTHSDEVSNWMLMASDAGLSLSGTVEVKTGREDPVLTDEYVPSAVLHAASGGM